MKREPLLAGIISLEMLLGCGPTEFPQYSGQYQLREVNYSDSSFRGDGQMPTILNVVDRMEHIGSHWNHYLWLEFIPQTDEQAKGSFTLELDNLARIDQGAWPNDWYDGAEIHREPKVYGTGSFCNYQYFYFLYLETKPSVEMLQEVYPGKGEYIGKDPSTKMPLYESLAQPEEVDFDDEEWYDAVEKNQGITLYFTLTRHIRSEFPGWEDGYKDCILPSDERNTASLSFTYHALEDDLNDETDVRKGKVEEIKVNQTSLSFFRKVVSDIK